MLFSSKRQFFSKMRLKKAAVFCLPGFHVDPVWRRTQAEYVEHSLSLVHQYLLACRADPYFGVYLSELDYLKPYLDLFPEERAWLKKLIQQERCTTGGAYNQPNETSIGGESLIRNLIIGQLYHKNMLESESLVFMGWDTFGHVPQMPQILQQCGMRAAVFTRTDYRDPTIPVPGMPDLFLWIAPNGSSVYARRIDYYLDQKIDLEEEAKKRFEKQKERLPNLNADLLIDAGDMFSPRAKIIGNCRELSNNEPSLITTGTAATKYFSCVETLLSGNKIKLEPVTRDLTQYNEGCELSRTDLKIANRLAENALYEAETWATIAAIYNIPYPFKPLDKAWRQVLFCQHHDGLTGCSTDIAFIDVLEAYRDALEIVTRTRRATLTELSKLVDTRSEERERALLTFNCLPWRRHGIVRYPMNLADMERGFVLMGADGSQIPYELEPVENENGEKTARVTAVWIERDLAAAGYRCSSLVEQEGADVPWIQKSQSQQWLENEFIRIEVNPERGGGIVSIVNKETGKEYVNTNHAQPANDVMALTEGAGDEPAWRLLTTGEKIMGSKTPAQVQCYEGPVTRRFLIRSSGPGPCNRIQEIRLYRGLPFIDCTTILENYNGYGEQIHEKNAFQKRDLYVLAFPLNLPGALPVLEDRFYAKAYRRSRGTMDFFSTFRTWKSGHAMNSCYRWVDVSWTFLIRFISGKQEVSSLAVGPSEVVIGRDHHRSLREKLIQHLARHGVACTPRYDKDEPGEDLLFRQCSFCIGKREENSYTARLLEENADANEYYERNMKEIGYVVLALDDKKKRQLPVFLFAGQNDAMTRQAVDELIQSTVAHRWECSTSACFMKRTGKVEDAGFALLNRGSTLCSLEKDGTLALALMHTVPYPSPQTPWSFDFAENKTHVFHYRLIPHIGDWRHAEIPRRAMEYNHEMYTLQTDSHDGPLAKETSFWSVEPGNILPSAIKPGGFPLTEMRSPQRNGSQITVRLYEAHGEESNIWLDSKHEVKSVRPLQINEKPATVKREIFREEQFIRTIAHANEIVTLNFDLKPPSEGLKSVKEISSPDRFPLPIRYWRYNMGAAPEGFLPVVISLRGQIKTQSYHEKSTIHHVELVISNNSAYEEQKGEVAVFTPPYWRVIPAKISYRLQPGTFQIIPLHILFEGPERDGFIKVRTTVDEVILEDMIHVGKEPEMDLSMVLTQDAFHVNLKHQYPYEISGFVSLITPVESWPKEEVGDYSLSSVIPQKQFYSLATNTESKLVFPMTEPHNRFGIAGDHNWMIIKLAAHYCLRYYHVRLDGKTSEGLGRIIHPPYEWVQPNGIE